MQKLPLALIGAVSLFALPALAQSSSQNGTSSSGTSSSSTQNSHSMQQMQQKIQSDLKQDGYTNVHVIPDSFLVHATDKRGQPVVMIINPDSVFAVTQLPGGQAGNSGSSSSQRQGLGSSPNSSHPTTRQ